MGLFSKKEEEKEDGFQKDKVGVIIHFTPAAIFLYTCDEFIGTLEGTLPFLTEDGDQVEIGGTFISLELDEDFRMDDIIATYKLKEINLPIVELKAFIDE
ncbi:hypothetical protein bcgnr5378_06190 [Bacillus cereus]|uniref:Uncharacterized protein n=1 Tax=Bacillus cereus TaxID=1396 RepID=A0A164LAR8_BACCE|nr:hypothetical protein [Bacillus cereus]KZD55611.1 hypothetical protein B4088_5356 [Bacillus cereus]